jgi:MFS family permease
LATSSILILLGGILFWFVSPHAPWTAYLYPLLAGLGFGAAYICLPTMLGNYYGAKVFASINGIAYLIVAIIELSATPLAGFLYDMQGSYFTVLLIGWIGTIIALAFMLLCKPPKPKI